MLTTEDADAVARAFAVGSVVGFHGPVARAVVGQVWRLDTDRGSWAVKEWFEEPDRAELAELDEGTAFQDAAATRGVPSPRTRRTSEGSSLARIGGRTVRVQEWVALRDRDPMLDPEAVGQLLAKLHQVPFRGKQPTDPWHTEPVGRARWERLVTALEVAGAPFAGQLTSLLEGLTALDALVVPPGELLTCHRDLWADNLRATTTDDLCVIDWEDCGLADPSMELAFVLWEFGRTDPRRARLLYDAYRGAGGPGCVRRASDFSMAIAQLGHIGARACTDWLCAEASSDGRAFAASRFAEFAGEPLTRETIETLLDAVAR